MCDVCRSVLSKQAKAQLRRKSQRIQEALVRSHDSHMTSHDMSVSIGTGLEDPGGHSGESEEVC